MSAEDAWRHVSDPKWREVDRAVLDFAAVEVNGEHRAQRFIDAVQEFKPRSDRKKGAKRAAPPSEFKKKKAPGGGSAA